MATRKQLQKVLEHIESVLEGLCIHDLNDIYEDDDACHIDYKTVARELQNNTLIILY